MWFYVHNKRAEGPVSEEILQDLLTQGALSREALVWRVGQATWEPATSVLAQGVNEDEGLTKRDRVRPPAIPNAEQSATDPRSSSGAAVSPGLAAPSGVAKSPVPPRGRLKSWLRNALLILMLPLGLFLFVGGLIQADREKSVAMVQPTTVQPPKELSPDLIRGQAPGQFDPGSVFIVLERGQNIYVLGKTETIEKLRNGKGMDEQYSFSGARADGRAIIFEAENGNVKLVNRLIDTYNKAYGTYLFPRE